MEIFVYIDGKFYDRMSGNETLIAFKLEADWVSREVFDDPICGKSVKLCLSKKSRKVALAMIRKEQRQKHTELMAIC